MLYEVITFRSAMAVGQHHAAVPGRAAQHEFARNGVVVRENRTGQAAATETCEFDGLVA